jgi:hypothetical protein
MSTPHKPDLARGWLRAEKLLDEEADRLATTSDEEFEREMNALPDPGHLPATREELDRGAAHRPTDRPNEPRAGRAWPRAQWVVSLLAAAFVAIALVVVVNRPATTGGSEKKHADEIRERAFQACAARQWRACEDQLDEAKTLDPPGDDDPRVQAAHAAAARGLHPDR